MSRKYQIFISLAIKCRDDIVKKTYFSIKQFISCSRCRNDLKDNLSIKFYKNGYALAGETTLLHST